MHKCFLAGIAVAAFPTLAVADTARVEAHYGSWMVFAASDPMTDKSGTEQARIPRLELTFKLIASLIYRAS